MPFRPEKEHDPSSPTRREVCFAQTSGLCLAGMTANRDSSPPAPARDHDEKLVLPAPGPPPPPVRRRATPPPPPKRAAPAMPVQQTARATRQPPPPPKRSRPPAPNSPAAAAGSVAAPRVPSHA